MPAGTAGKSSIAAQWRAARRLYPIYAAIATQFQLGTPPYESLTGVSDTESDLLQRVEEWLAEMDDHIQAHQFRHILQTSFLATSEDKLHVLIERHLRKERKTEADRDKMAFLLVQYFALCAPPSFHEREVTLEDVAEVLEPALGECSAYIPSWLQPLEELIAAMRNCTSLRELDEKRIIETGRNLRASAGEMFFGPSALLAFTYFGYLLRRACFELMDADIKAVEDGLLLLEERAVAVVDCASLQLSDHEPLESVRQICRNWHRSVTPDYSSDNSFERLLALRTAVDKAVAAAMEPMSLEAASAAYRRLERRVVELTAEVTALRRRVNQLTGEETSAPAEPDSKSTAAPVPGAASAPAPAPAGQAAAPANPSDGPAAAGNGNSREQAERIAASELAACMARMKEMFAGKKIASAASIAVAGTKLLLTPYEVNAFGPRADGNAGLVQKAAASRVLLVDAIEEYKRTRQRNALHLRLPAALATADEMRAEIARLRERRQSEEAENLAALVRQLQAIVQQAQGFAGPA